MTKASSNPRQTDPPLVPVRISDVRVHVEGVGNRLARAYRAVLMALPEAPGRAIDLARALQLNKNLAHRVFSALQKDNPVEVLLVMPGPALLIQVAAAAKAQGVSEDLCAAALRESRAFEMLIQAVAGNRSSFDALIGEWVPHVREQLGTAARQTVFRGMRQVLGISAEVQLSVLAFHPNPDVRSRVDVLGIGAYRGLERIKTSGNLCVAILSRLENRSVEAESTRTLIEEFCSQPPPSFRVHGSHENAICMMEWDDAIGRGSSRDVVFAERHRRAFTRYAETPMRPLSVVGDVISVPTARAVVDLLFHRDIYNTVVPAFRALTGGSGPIADANDPLTEHYRIPMECPIQRIETGRLARTITPEAPMYHDLLRSQFEPLGWRIDEFRAFRVRIEYPLYNSQMQFVIPLPPKPE